MDRNHLFVAVVLVCMLNGLFSPALLAVVAAWPVWFPTMLLSPSQGALLYVASLILSTATLVLSGIPAAIYERVRGSEESDGASIMVWLVGALVLSAPALFRLGGLS